jgi:Ohr subfamily peroxiredoxin
MTIALSKVAYTTAATAKGGRAGHVKSADGVIDLDLGQPGSYQGEPKANPETLFAAGYSACFQGALANRAKTRGIDTSDSTVTAEVSFGPSDDGGFGLSVELKVNIPGVDPSTARELVELAHEFCPYSKATRGYIDVTLTLV